MTEHSLAIVAIPDLRSFMAGNVTSGLDARLMVMCECGWNVWLGQVQTVDYLAELAVTHRTTDELAEAARPLIDDDRAAKEAAIAEAREPRYTPPEPDEPFSSKWGTEQ